MSNIINSSILAMNKGTAKSGWWNPDHAARVAGKSCKIAADFVGKGEYLASAIANSDYIKESAYDKAYKITTVSTAVSKTFQSVRDDVHQNRPEGADVECIKRSGDGREELPIKGRPDSERLNEIGQVCEMIDGIASDLTYYATGNDYQPKSLVNIRKDIGQARVYMANHVRRDPKDGSYFALRDKNGKEQAVLAPLESTLQYLEIYINSIK